MTEQEKYKAAMREYYDSQHTPYNHNDWVAASQLLIRERKKRKRRFAFYFAMPLLILSGLYSFWFFTDSPPATSLQSTHQITPQTFPSTDNQIAPDAIAKTVNQAVGENSPPNKEQSLSLVVTTKPYKDPNGHKPANTTNTKTTAYGPQMHSSLITGLRDISRDETPNYTDINTNTPAYPSTNETSITKKDSTVASASRGTAHTVESSSIALPKDSMPPVAFNSEDSLPQNNNPAYTALNGTQTADSSHAINAEAKNAILTDSVINKKKYKDAFVFELGLAQSFGWKYLSREREAIGRSPVFGISYAKTIHPKFWCQFGLRYQSVSPLFSSSKVSRVGYYTGYGEESTVTTITPVRLHYLIAPFKCHLVLNEHHHLGLGLNVGYLMNVSAKVTAYNEKPGYTGPTQTSTQSGYMQGFHWIDAQLAASYTYKLNSEWALHSELYYGWIDIKEDAFFNRIQIERNSGIKLSLLYFMER